MDDPVDQVVDITEGASLLAFAEDRDRLVTDRFPDEGRDDPAVERVHPRAVGVENSHDPNVGPVLAMIVHKERFGDSLPLIVTRSGTDRVDRAAIGFRLRVDFRIAVDLAGRGLQNFRLAASGDAQHVDRAEHRGFYCLDRVVLVVARCGRAGKVVNFVDFQKDGHRHVVPDQLEVGPVQQVGYIGFLAREEVVEADNVMALIDQPVAEMGADKPGTTTYKNSFNQAHESFQFSVFSFQYSASYLFTFLKPDNEAIASFPGKKGT